jgi:hypothetical protein
MAFVLPQGRERSVEVGVNYRVTVRSSTSPHRSHTCAAVIRVFRLGTQSVPAFWVASWKLGTVHRLASICHHDRFQSSADDQVPHATIDALAFSVLDLGLNAIRALATGTSH